MSPSEFVGSDECSRAVAKDIPHHETHERRPLACKTACQCVHNFWVLVDKQSLKPWGSAVGGRLHVWADFRLDRRALSITGASTMGTPRDPTPGPFATFCP